jgi:hypothetical protein
MRPRTSFTAGAFAAKVTIAVVLRPAILLHVRYAARLCAPIKILPVLPMPPIIPVRTAHPRRRYDD